MMTYVEDAKQRNWLISLWVLWAALLFGGLLFAPNSDMTHRMPTWTRIASSAMLVAAGWSWFVFHRGRLVARFALFIAIGMSFGLIGDLELAGWLPGGRNVLLGIAAFGWGHVFYIAAGLYWGKKIRAAGTRFSWAALLVWLVIGAAAWYIVVFHGQEPTVLHWAALPYSLLLAGMAGVATGLGLETAVFIPFAVGGALFLTSDLILAAQLFNEFHFPLIGDVIWLTYGPGQMLIVYAVGAAQKSSFSRS